MLVNTEVSIKFTCECTILIRDFYTGNLIADLLDEVKRTYSRSLGVRIVYHLIPFFLIGLESWAFNIDLGGLCKLVVVCFSLIQLKVGRTQHLLGRVAFDEEYFLHSALKFTICFLLGDKSLSTDVLHVFFYHDFLHVIRNLLESIVANQIHAVGLTIMRNAGRNYKGVVFARGAEHIYTLLWHCNVLFISYSERLLDAALESLVEWLSVIFVEELFANIDGDVSKHALTSGLRTIIKRHLILLRIYAVCWNHLIAKEGDCFQICAETKCAFTNGCYFVRNCHIGKFLTIEERVVANLFYRWG